jgi:hypothetical protein
VSLENNQQVKSDENQEHSAKVDNSRRSFAKKSAAIAPVIMTLANRSAWGAGISNACVGSGLAFQSYITAKDKGIALSHHVKTQVSGWLKPRQSLPSGTAALGWYETISWPNGYLPYHFIEIQDGDEWYAPSTGGGNWNQNSNARVKRNELPAGKIFVSDVSISGYATTLTLFDALNGSDITLAYDIAAVLNQANTPSVAFPTLLTDDDYARFYAECT